MTRGLILIFNTHSLFIQYFSLLIQHFSLLLSCSYSTPIHFYFNTFHSHFLILTCGLIFIFNTHYFFQHFSLSLSSFKLRSHIQHSFTFISTLFTFTFFLWPATSYSYSTSIQVCWNTFYFPFLICGLIFIFNTHSLLFLRYSLSLSSFLDLRTHIHIQHQFTIFQHYSLSSFWPATSYSYSTPIHFYFDTFHFPTLTCSLIFKFNTRSNFVFTFHFHFLLLMWDLIFIFNTRSRLFQHFSLSLPSFWPATSHSYSTSIHFYINTFHSHFLLLICDLLFIWYIFIESQDTFDTCLGQK